MQGTLQQPKVPANGRVVTSSDASPATWQPGPPAPVVQAPDVDVWRAPLRVTWAEGCARWPFVLNKDEIRQVARLRFIGERRRFVAAHLAFREVLGRYLRCTPEDVPITWRVCSRCGLRHGRRVADEEVSASLAYAGEWALVAIARGRTVGVDIQQAATNVTAGLVFALAATDIGLPAPASRPNDNELLVTLARNRARGRAVSESPESLGSCCRRPSRATRRAAARGWAVAGVQVPGAYAAAVAWGGTNASLRLLSLT